MILDNELFIICVQNNISQIVILKDKKVLFCKQIPYGSTYVVSKCASFVCDYPDKLITEVRKETRYLLKDSPFMDKGFVRPSTAILLRKTKFFMWVARYSVQKGSEDEMLLNHSLWVTPDDMKISNLNSFREDTCDHALMMFDQRHDVFLHLRAVCIVGEVICRLLGVTRIIPSDIMSVKEFFNIFGIRKKNYRSVGSNLI